MSRRKLRSSSFFLLLHLILLVSTLHFDRGSVMTSAMIRKIHAAQTQVRHPRSSSVDRSPSQLKSCVC